MDERVPEGVVRVRANNPSPLTLDGTNTWVAGRWVVDPGPADDAHLDAVVAAAADGIEGIVLTHSHADHAEGADGLASRAGGVPVLRPEGDGPAGPFSVIATPGHSADSVCLLWERVLFTGDTILGAGSVFIAPGEGSLGAYLDSLRRLLTLDLEAICPGHGPVVWDARGRIEEYLEHRLERERKVLAALDAGARTHDELLEVAWSDVDFESVPGLRMAAALTLAAHLEKLRDEGRLPPGVEL
jgi:glyoxylase-like metal-dependent hydrolase (beta-lactamase superfamily II)